MDRNPYAVPAAEVADVAPAAIDNTELTRWVRWSVYLQIIVAIVALVSINSEQALLGEYAAGTFASDEEATAAGEANDSRQQVVGIAQVLVALTSGILILTWIYRINVKAGQLGATGMTFTPGWSVGWYFVPFFNFWKPYQAMKEIWQASASRGGWTPYDDTPSLLGWWWFFWIVSNLLSNASFRLSARAKGIDDLVAANWVTTVADAVNIPLCLLLLLMISRIDAMQSAEQSVV